MKRYIVVRCEDNYSVIRAFDSFKEAQDYMNEEFRILATKDMDEWSYIHDDNAVLRDEDNNMFLTWRIYPILFNLPEEKSLHSHDSAEIRAYAKGYNAAIADIKKINNSRE